MSNPSLLIKDLRIEDAESTSDLRIRDGRIASDYDRRKNRKL